MGIEPWTSCLSKFARLLAGHDKQFSDKYHAVSPYIQTSTHTYRDLRYNFKSAGRGNNPCREAALCLHCMYNHDIFLFNSVIVKLTVLWPAS